MIIPEIKVPSINEYNILDINEKFVKLSDYDFKCESQYYKQGIAGAPRDCYVRKSVKDKLIIAQDSLPKGYKLLIFDGWRPVCVQERLWNYYRRKLSNEDPTLNGEELDFKTSFFVSKPSYDIYKPSLHNTGGAVDLTIIDENGKMLDMGTDFDDFSDKSWTNRFEKYEENKIVRDNRRLLYEIMISAGFSNLPSEWWHYEYGSKFWAYFHNTDALYKGQLELPFKYKKFSLC